MTDTVKLDTSGGIAINGKFIELPKEKRQKIINAGFEVFGGNDYKHASTEDIAAKAGISKGLLFYYFQNKRSFYTFLFGQAVELVKSYVVDEHMEKMTDFFAFCEYAAERKCRMLCQSPHITDFIVRAYYSQREEVSRDINAKLRAEMSAAYETYFKNIDFSKFRDGMNPKDIFDMLTWLTDGYIHERQRAGLNFDLNDIMEKFRLWSALFKRLSYKEEYLK